MRVVTIASRRALPSVRVLARSLLASNPSALFAAVLVDLLPGVDRLNEDFEVVDPSELALAEDDFARMTFMYDEDELAASLRPWALEWALRKGDEEVVIQLAPETVVLAGLREVEEAALRRGLGLCPRRLTSPPQDGLRPDDEDLVLHGWLDPGLLAVTEAASPWLQAWQAHLVGSSGGPLAQRASIESGWLDSSAALLDFARLADPGLNVSFWNIDERTLEGSDQGLTCEGQPLRTFQFADYDPSMPWCLSAQVKDRPRVVLSDHPSLITLLDERARDLSAASRPKSDVTSYRYNTFGDGVPISRGIRMMYRREVLKHREADAVAPEPPVPDHRGGFSGMRAWLGEPSPRMPRLTRLSYDVWASRGDLQEAFPRPQTDSGFPYQKWLTTHGVEEGYLAPDWLGVAQPLATAPTPVAKEAGCNVFGYFSSVLGVGTTGRALLTAAMDAGLPVTVRGSTDTESPKIAAVEDSSSALRYPINLVAINADLFPLWSEKWGPEFTEGAYTVGLWAWELEELPLRMQASVDHVDEIWALSEFNASAFTPLGKPVHVFPVPSPSGIRRAFPHLSGLTPEKGYFLCVFDYLSEVERKNPLGLISAYRAAFPANDGPKLVIKSINGSRRRTARERVRLAAARTPGILLIEDYLPAEALESLLQHALAFVSLHRSEGFGMGLLEAMAQGTPTIATAYSGNLDFMSERNSLLVPYTLAPVTSEGGYYAGLGQWAEPDLAVAAAHLRMLAQDRALAAALGERAQRAVSTMRTAEHAAAFVRGRVDEIMRGELERALKARTAPERRPSTLRRLGARLLSRIK